MKRQSIYLFLIIVLSFSSCQLTYFHGRKYAHRDYVRIGKHEASTMPEVNRPPSTTVAENETNVETKQVFLADTNNVPQTLPNKIISSRKSTKIVSAQTTTYSKRQAFSKKHIRPKFIKKTNESSALNTIGLAVAILALVGFFAAGIVLLISLLSISLLMPGITMLWICFGLALVGMILGALGVGLKHPGKGMGIAALVIGSIVLLSVFLIVILIAAL